ncbi:MAG: hypothetical protein V1859_07175 [archaeon]
MRISTVSLMLMLVFLSACTDDLTLSSLLGAKTESATAYVPLTVTRGKADWPPITNEISTTDVYISNDKFQPSTVYVSRGATVRWVEMDEKGHRIDSKGMLFDSPYLKQGDSWTYTFYEKGIFTYNSRYHPLMRGKVVVE